MFALFAHRNLANDIIEAKGVYLDNLNGYFAQKNLAPPALSELKNTLYSYEETPRFADAIIALYQESKSLNVSSCKR